MKTRCGVCGKPLEPGETIHVAELGPRCYPCFNQETADRLGIDFDEPRFQPIVLEDADGRSHTLKFRSMLVPAGHELEALEIIDDPHEGYRFAILGDFDADPWELFQRLHAKMRTEIATRHVERTEFGWQLTRNQQLIGRIEWDPDSDIRLPLIVIDGKPFTWEQVGRQEQSSHATWPASRHGSRDCGAPARGDDHRRTRQTSDER